MTRRTRESEINGQSILVIEDDYMIADDLRIGLEEAGASVVGPAPSIETALRLLAETPVDLAVLDIDLRGDKAFAVADALKARGVHFVFATGYDQSFIPEPHASSPHVEKPVNVDEIIAALTGPTDSRS